MHNLFDLRDAAFFAGLALLCAGLGAFDWRWAAMAGGVVLLGVALAPALRKGE